MTTRHKSVLLAVLALCGLLALGAGVQLVVASGQGADFANVFKEPATAVTTEADITWTDGDRYCAPSSRKPSKRSSSRGCARSKRWNVPESTATPAG